MPDVNRILVIGGGFSGLTTAVDAAETGAEVIVIEKNPYLGGRVAQLNKYFPKLCPPICGLEINFRRIKTNPNITFYTMAEVESIAGGPGDYNVTVKVNPRHVNDNCVACDACAQACPAERPNEYNFGMDKTKAAFLPFNQAFPQKYVIDSAHCKGDCGKVCKEACKYNAIDLDMKPLIPDSAPLCMSSVSMMTGNKVKMKFDMVVLATGMEPSGAAKKISGVNYNENGFALPNLGIHSAGCSKNPMDVARSAQDATGAAMKAISTAKLAGQGR